MNRCLPALMVLALAAAPAAGDDSLSSQRDYSDDTQRDLAIACKPDDLVRHPGKSLGQLFGADWPAAPASSSVAAHTRAYSTGLGNMVWPRGLEGQRALVVLAVLVAADGSPVRAEPLCLTRQGFDRAASRAAMTGSYVAATVDGVAVASPTIVVVRFEQGRPRAKTRRGELAD